MVRRPHITPACRSPGPQVSLPTWARLWPTLLACSPPSEPSAWQLLPGLSLPLPRPWHVSLVPAGILSLFFSPRKLHPPLGTWPLSHMLEAAVLSDSPSSVLPPLNVPLDCHCPCPRPPNQTESSCLPKYPQPLAQSWAHRSTRVCCSSPPGHKLVS